MPWTFYSPNPFARGSEVCVFSESAVDVGPANTASEVSLFTVVPTVPAGMMGPNGFCTVNVWTNAQEGTAATATLKFYINGSSVWNLGDVGLSNQAAQHMTFVIANRGATNSQRIMLKYLRNSGGAGANDAWTDIAVDLSAAFTVDVKMQFSVANANNFMLAKSKSVFTCYMA